MDELYRTQVKSVPMFNGMQVPAALRIFILNLVDALCPSAKRLDRSILVVTRAHSPTVVQVR
jgi:hypothetical protein